MEANHRIRSRLAFAQNVVCHINVKRSLADFQGKVAALAPTTSLPSKNLWGDF